MTGTRAHGVHAVAWSGGKDSMLALDRLVRDGRDVRVLFNLYDRASGRVRFHGVRREHIQRQAERLGMSIVQLPTAGGDFESVFQHGLGQLQHMGVRAIAFGNIHLADVRAWYEERTTAEGFVHVEPLWANSPADLLHELLERGYRTRVVSVDLSRAKRDWLGRELDSALVAEIIAENDVDAAGERGEYHTFLFDGPLLRAPIPLVPGQVQEAEGHAMIELRY